MDYPIIDFHTHPFIDDKENICTHLEYFNVTLEDTKPFLQSVGIQNICGSVTGRVRMGEPDSFEPVKQLNDKALYLRDYFKGFYIPGFHIHPKFVNESIKEIERMHKEGVKLVGELVPYTQGWSKWDSKELFTILTAVQDYGMVLNFHALVNPEQEDQIDTMVRTFPNLVIVGAHPGDANTLNRHLNRMKISDNYYVDLSGGMLHRMGTLKHGVQEFGAKRFLFGTDFPICNPGSYIGGIMLDPLISEEDKPLIMYQNAKRILEIK